MIDLNYILANAVAKFFKIEEKEFEYVEGMHRDDENLSMPADFHIGPVETDPYMRRWYIIPRNSFFNVYLHHMRHDDDDRALHDHPWWSISLCLAGLIKEHLEDGDRIVAMGDWRFRTGKMLHRLSLPFGDAWTIFITGPKFREWGFACSSGWTHWQDFVDPANPGQPGRGCGENIK